MLRAVGVQREANGHNYYQVEFTAANSRYTRHQLAVVAVSNGEARYDEHGHTRRLRAAGQRNYARSAAVRFPRVLFACGQHECRPNR